MENNKKTIIIFLDMLLLLGAWDILLLTKAVSHSGQKF